MSLGNLHNKNPAIYLEYQPRKSLSSIQAYISIIEFLCYKYFSFQLQQTLLMKNTHYLKLSSEKNWCSIVCTLKTGRISGMEKFKWSEIGRLYYTYILMNISDVYIQYCTQTDRHNNIFSVYNIYIWIYAICFLWNLFELLKIIRIQWSLLHLICYQLK